MMKRLSAFLVVTTLAAGILQAEEKKKTRDEMVLDDRTALQEDDHWIYNDLAKGFETAKALGKPLMVVHRCIP